MDVEEERRELNEWREKNEEESIEYIRRIEEI